MRIPIHCEHCGELIATFDTTEDTSVEWAEAPWGEKVCDECCAECVKQHDPYHACMYRAQRLFDPRGSRGRTKEGVGVG